MNIYAFVFIALLFQQTQTETLKDITKKFNDAIWNTGDGYSLMGAGIDSENRLHITTNSGDLETNYFRIKSPSYSMTAARKHLLAIGLFQKAERIFSAYPKITEINEWAATFDVDYDKYGNETYRNKKILAHLRLTRETFNKINFDFVYQTGLFSPSGFGDQKLIQMLDTAWFDPNYF